MSRGELERIRWGPEPGQPVGGIGSVRIVARCKGNSEQVLKSARDVLEIVCSQGTPSDPEKWRDLLPRWFVNQLAPEPSQEEFAKYLLLPYEERMKAENNEWTLAGWLHWFEPDNRYWCWWDGAVMDRNTLVVAIEVTEWPFPWEALKWLLLAAGATEVKAEE